MTKSMLLLIFGGIYSFIFLLLSNQVNAQSEQSQIVYFSNFCPHHNTDSSPDAEQHLDTIFKALTIILTTYKDPKLNFRFQKKDCDRKYELFNEVKKNALSDKASVYYIYLPIYYGIQDDGHFNVKLMREDSLGTCSGTKVGECASADLPEILMKRNFRDDLILIIGGMRSKFGCNKLKPDSLVISYIKNNTPILIPNTQESYEATVAEAKRLYEDDKFREALQKIDIAKKASKFWSDDAKSLRSRILIGLNQTDKDLASKSQEIINEIESMSQRSDEDTHILAALKIRPPRIAFDWYQDVFGRCKIPWYTNLNSDWQEILKDNASSLPNGDLDYKTMIQRARIEIKGTSKEHKSIKNFEGLVNVTNMSRLVLDNVDIDEGLTLKGLEMYCQGNNKLTIEYNPKTVKNIQVLEAKAEKYTNITIKKNSK